MIWVASAALAAWTSDPVAAPGPHRAIALAMDPLTGERFFALDSLSDVFVGPVRVGSPQVTWIELDGGVLSAPQLVSDHLASNSTSYMATLSVPPGSALGVVASRYDIGVGAAAFESFLVQRSTGAVIASSRRISDDFATIDQGRLSLVASTTDGAHACFTAHVHADDIVVNHTVGGLWADPLSGDDYAPPLPTVEDHCGIGLLSDGTRVIVNHHNPGDQVYVTLEDTLGSPTAGTPLELLSGGGVAYNHPVVTVADVGGADEVHVVATSLTGAHGVVHRSCARSGAVTCGDPADWSATDTVVPAGTLTERPWPQVAVDAQGTVYVAWVEERVGATDTIEVAYRCAGGSFVDAGVVTTAPGEQAFASDGVGNVNNRMLSGPRIAVDDVAGEVGLVYLLVDGGSSTPMFAHQPLATCP